MQDIRKLTEGAIVTALYLIILLLTIYIPFFGLLLIWFLPLPYIIYVLRHGIKASIVVWLATMLGTFIVGGVVLVPLTIMFGSGGIVVGELFRRQKSAFAVLLGGSLTYIVNLLLSFILSIVVLDIHPLHDTQMMMKESLDTANSMLGQLGQDPSEQLQVYYEFVDMLPQFAPFMIISMGIVYALFIQLVSSFVLRKMNFRVSTFPPFRKWTFPKSFLWYYLIVLIIMLVGVEKGTGLYTVVINLFPMLEIIMAIQGISLLFYYVYEKGMSKAFPMIAVGLIIIFPPLMTFIRILGILDLGFDLRSRIQQK